MNQDDPAQLVSLLLACDLTWSELLRLAEEYLGIQQIDAAVEMGDGSTGMESRVANLVRWADRHGMISRLTDGVLIEHHDKRAVRDWILSRNQTMQPTQQPIADSYTLLRMDIRMLTEQMARVLENQTQLRAEVMEMKRDQADAGRRIAVVEAATTVQQQHRSPAIDRFMVGLMMFVMIAMLAFNLWAVR